MKAAERSSPARHDDFCGAGFQPAPRWPGKPNWPACKATGNRRLAGEGQTPAGGLETRRRLKTCPTWRHSRKQISPPAAIVDMPAGGLTTCPTEPSRQAKNRMDSSTEGPPC
jgi:hypothetical protein